MAQVRVVLEHVAEDGRQQEQQGEQREQPLVGDAGGLRAGPVVAELLHHRERERHHGVALLEPVDAPDGAFDGVHEDTLDLEGSDAAAVATSVG